MKKILLIAVIVSFGFGVNFDGYKLTKNENGNLMVNGKVVEKKLTEKDNLEIEIKQQDLLIKELIKQNKSQKKVIESLEEKLKDLEG